MSYRYERSRPERRRSRVGCLAWLVALIWIVLLGVLAYRFLVRPQVSRYVGSQIGEQLRSNIGGQVGRQIEQGALVKLRALANASDLASYLEE